MFCGIMKCLMLGFENQVIGNYHGIMVYVYLHEL